MRIDWKLAFQSFLFSFLLSFFVCSVLSRLGVV